MWWYYIAKAAATGYANFMQFRQEKAMLKMQKNMYETQAKMAREKAKTTNEYLNEELGHVVWNSYDNMINQIGQQSAAMGSSGFDQSLGDKRLIEDTYERERQFEYGVNRTAQLQAFENEKQAKMEENEYNFAAWSAKQQLKNYKGLRGFNNLQIKTALGLFTDMGGDFMNMGKGQNVAPTRGWDVNTQGLDSLGKNIQSNYKPGPWESFGKMQF